MSYRLKKCNLHPNSPYSVPCRAPYSHESRIPPQLTIAFCRSRRRNRPNDTLDPWPCEPNRSEKLSDNICNILRQTFWKKENKLYWGLINCNYPNVATLTVRLNIAKNNEQCYCYKLKCSSIASYTVRLYLKSCKIQHIGFIVYIRLISRNTDLLCIVQFAIQLLIPEKAARMWI